MDNQTPPSLPQTQYLQLSPQKAPTTKLLHFTLLTNAISTGIAGVFYLIAGLGAAVGSSEDSIRGGMVFGVLLLAAIIGGSVWYWWHCLKTLRTLRAYAEQLFYASLRK